MEKDYCNKCGECCKNIAVDFYNRVMYRDGIQPVSEEFFSFLTPVGKKENITFCKCKFLSNNLCTNPNKPQECIDYPKSPFAFLNEDCGYTGDIFLKNESVKQKVRKLKEEILDYQTRLKNEPSLQKIIDNHEAFINKYKSYGSDNW